MSFSAPRRGGSDDSQERQRPRKRADKRPVYEGSPSPEASDYEEEMEYEERAEYVAVPTRHPSSRRPTYMPPPPPVQPNAEGRRISLEPPQLLGRALKDFTKVPKAAYFKFRRDIDQFAVEQDSMDPRFRTNVQADIFTTVVLPKGLSQHLYIDLEHIRANPVKYPGAIELIESSGLALPFAYQHDFSEAAILQFYATCFFHPNKTVTWMTSDTEITASYADFVAALGFPDVGFKIHKDDPNHRPKPVDKCGFLLKDLADIPEEDRLRDVNQVAIWRSPYFIIFQCVIRTIYPKMGDKGSCNSYCIDLMHRLV